MVSLTLALWWAAEPRMASAVAQGEVLRVEVDGAAPGWTAEGWGKRVRFFPLPTGERASALLPVGALEKPKVAPVVIRDGAGLVVHEGSVRIADARFRIRNLTPTSTMSSLKPSPGEIETTARLLKTVSDERHWTEPLLAPTGACIISPFGVQTWYNGKPSGSYHRGIDLFSGAGTPVKATADGVVRIAQMWNMQGGTIGIDHGQGVVSTYLHLSKLVAQEGQTVRRGEVVGLVGSTGFSTGPHLHWGLAVNGEPVNGASWVPAMRPCGAAPARRSPARKRVAKKK